MGAPVYIVRGRWFIAEKTVWGFYFSVDGIGVMVIDTIELEFIA